ncbi:MAG TPA: hypothetical protein VMG34_14790 [Bacteroidota bacterium]|nr:hypothetical protein [Bacteroidota bacterium]
MATNIKKKKSRNEEKEVPVESLFVALIDGRAILLPKAWLCQTLSALEPTSRSLRMAGHK